jgi:hypothetical protein
MAEIYDESNYRAQAPEPTYSGAGRRIKPENFFAPQGSVINFSEVAVPLGVNALANVGKDYTRLLAAGGSKIPGIRKIAKPVSNFFDHPGMRALDKAQSVLGPVTEFVTDANSSQDLDHNKYVDLGVNAVGGAADYYRMIPSPAALVAWPLGGTAEGLQNESSAKDNIALAGRFDPKLKDNDSNVEIVAQMLRAANASWGKGSAYGMAPFNPYDRLQSAMASETGRIAQIIAAGGDDEDAYYDKVGEELKGLAELIRLAADEEGDRANPVSVFGGGTFARLQTKANAGGRHSLMTQEQKDAETIGLLRQAAQMRARDKAIQSERANRLREAVLNGYHLDPYNAPSGNVAEAFPGFSL